jgi:hypothetical protein
MEVLVGAAFPKRFSLCTIVEAQTSIPTFRLASTQNETGEIQKSLHEARPSPIMPTAASQTRLINVLLPEP